MQVWQYFGTNIILWFCDVNIKKVRCCCLRKVCILPSPADQTLPCSTYFRLILLSASSALPSPNTGVSTLFHKTQKATQDPVSCTCGGPTSTVCVPTTVVSLPSMPRKVQLAPPAELMEVMLDPSTDRASALARSGGRMNETAKRRETGGEWGKVRGTRKRGTTRRVGTRGQEQGKERVSLTHRRRRSCRQ